MTRIVDSRTIAPGDRIDTILAMARAIVPVELDFPQNAPVVRGTVTDIGVLRLTSIGSNASRVERTPKLARDDLPPSVMLGMQARGSSVIIQDGREATARPGDLVVYRSTAPYTIIDHDGYRQHQLRMPQHGLALPTEVIRQVTATRLSPRHPVSDLAHAYFQRLIRRQRALSYARAHAVGPASLELIRALIGTHLDAGSRLTREAHEATLLLRILGYIRAHLGEPTLNATRIAAEHHISVRRLYNVLAAGDISLGDWIRQRRLEACRAELARQHAQETTIAAVAQRWGFRDASNFGRVFRAEYGTSPSRWRASVLAGSGEAQPAPPTETGWRRASLGPHSD